MSTKNDKVSALMGTAIFGAATLLMTAGAVDLMSVIAHSGPRVGDIITFDPARQPIDSDARFLVQRPAQFACVLDLHTLTQSGGSMVVESHADAAPGDYRLHWAGGRTSPDTGNCGASADVIVNRHEMDLLTIAAGGIGLDHKAPPGFAASAPY